MNSPIVILHTRRAYLLDPLFEMDLTGATRLVVVSRGVHFEHTAAWWIETSHSLRISSTSLRFRAGLRAFGA
jgi:hypothetical protein